MITCDFPYYSIDKFLKCLIEDITFLFYLRLLLDNVTSSAYSKSYLQITLVANLVTLIPIA